MKKGKTMALSKEATKARNILIILFIVMFLVDVVTVYFSKEVVGAIRLVLTFVIMNLIIWGSRIAKIIFSILIVMGGLWGLFLAYKFNANNLILLSSIISVYSLFALGVAAYMNFNTDIKKYFIEIKK